MRRWWLKPARAVERGLERIGRKQTPPILEAYTGYATPDAWVLRARVLTHLRRHEPRPEQSRWTNFRQMVSLFLTDEVADVPVTARGRTARSDAEGYVTLHVPPEAADPAWADVELALSDGTDRVYCQVRVVPDDAPFMVISDIDDTMIETGAHSLARNLWTTFTGSLLTRSAHADAVDLMARLTDGGRRPVYYVSSSPWNLHRFLEGVFERTGLPRGPMFLRDLGLSDEGHVGESHHGHKRRAIETVLAANPGLPAVLLGDTGQEDAEIYAGVVEDIPGRIRGVALREPAPGVGARAGDAIARIEAAGVPCHHGPSFAGAADRLLGGGTEAPGADVGR